jgi:hypothetical protein
MRRTGTYFDREKEKSIFFLTCWFLLLESVRVSVVDQELIILDPAFLQIPNSVPIEFRSSFLISF